MKQITVLVGISGAGKSTYAHQEWAKDPDNTTIVSRDKIRELLFGFNPADVEKYYEREDVYKLEKKVTRYEDTLIHEALSHGNRVIVDATHLKRSYIERYKYWNVPVDVITFDIEYTEALKRVRNRDRFVDKEIMQTQWNRYCTLIRDLKENPIDFTPITFEQDDSNRCSIVFDIDGTLAIRGDRSPYDWQKVGIDTQDYAVCQTIRGLKEEGHENIIICTGRDKESLDETEKWLFNNGIPYDEIYYRPKGDMRPDWVVKEEMWRKIAEENYIVAMYDDRQQVVRRARALGLKVFNVEYNNF